MLDLTCPNFNILIGTSDISLHVTGFSFRHPLAEPSTPLIWTGQIELDLTVDTSLGATFFDDEINPSRWLSGLQPIDVYFESTLWQRFRIKPNGYRYDQTTGQAVVEVTDIIGILDSYQPSADAPEFKTGQNNFWNTLAVKLIQKQAILMGATVTVQTPPYGIGGIYKVPRSIKGSYIKEAQKMAGERGYWMWCDQEVIKWAKYPRTAQNIVWQKSRKELLNYTRQQGLDPIKENIIVSATHEDIDTCQDQYPKTSYTYATAEVARTGANDVLKDQVYQYVSSTTVKDKEIQNNYIYTYTTRTRGVPILILFGAQIQPDYTIKGEAPAVKGAIANRLDKFISGDTTTYGSTFDYRYEKQGINRDTNFNFRWTSQQDLLCEKDVTTYENVPFDAQNASKIVSRVVRRAEPWAKFPEALQYYAPSYWFQVPSSFSSFEDYRITERTTTKYKYVEIFRTDIIVTAGQKLYEIEEVVELKEQTYFYVERFGTNKEFKRITGGLVANQLTQTKYKKECQGRWIETKTVSQNKGQSKDYFGYLFGTVTNETVVNSIPEITYRPAPYPVIQRPLLAKATTGYAGVSPYVNSNEFVNASTLTTKGELEAYAAMIGRMKWQRYYSREIAAGYGTVLSYSPFQGVYAGNGAYIRDRFGVSLNRDKDSWQFVEDCIGNKTGAIAEILPPSLPYPPILSSTLNIGSVPTQNYTAGVATSITFMSSGGVTPYTYASTTLPTGLALSSGALSGTPTTAGTTSVTVTVTDSLGATDTTTFNIVVAAITPISIVSETYELEIELNEVYTFEVMGGIKIPIEGIYNDLSEYTFEIVVSGNSNLVIPSPLLDSGSFDIKAVSSDLIIASTILAATVEKNAIDWEDMTQDQWFGLTETQWRNIG